MTVISDAAEYGCCLFSHAAVPLLADFMKGIETDVIGKGLASNDNTADNKALVAVNVEIRFHDVEIVGAELRAAMGNMKSL